MENFLNLLVELKILTPPEQTKNAIDEFSLSSQEITPQPPDIRGASADRYVPLTHESQQNQSAPLSQEGKPDYCVPLSQESQQNQSAPQDKGGWGVCAPLDKGGWGDHSEDKIAALQTLQELLIGDELAQLQNLTNTIQQNLTKLEHQIYEPEELINLLLPWVTELLKLKVAESKQDEVAEAIAPTMGKAIKKQIEIEEDTVVDALYPIIGSTIAKYMAETIQSINQKIEETLSPEGIKRKIRAKVQGVSEAELILQEALPFTVQAIFLIHKASGLVISDIQRSDTERLESEMVAGMLTAIRSFVNDCITPGHTSELDAIDYGTSKIILEVAGYCYLAIVVQGKPSKTFIGKMRQTLGKIVKDYGESIEKFDGDPETIPSQVHTLLNNLQHNPQQKQHKNRPSPLLLLSLTALSIILIPWGIWQYRSGVIHAMENKTSLALASAPELAVYRLTVTGDYGTLKLTGRVPNQLLRLKAEQIARNTAPKWLIDNQILSVEVPADPILATAEVKRVTQVLNQIDGTAISAEYKDSQVFILGSVSKITDAKTVTQAFAQIPGVKSVTSAVRVQPLRIEVRFYFQGDSATLLPKDLGYKLGQIKLFLNQHPMKRLRIIGYSYFTKSAIAAQKLALDRSKAVQQALINQGIDPSRLQVIGKTTLPPGIDSSQPTWLRRCVVLEPI
ncbi:BON domain-containing protein [Iningainema sp. BLCCT55]|uniref:BON domain-containing protein n=2 Tax=Iningainema TaxID=1932705 RepID=A0A8J7C9A9_9CYAN|nr:BON domain-containing protein [Iningainema tapete]MBD2770820.1 BON domain-containing protein [Iningainema tapete BLCC-T55]